MKALLQQKYIVAFSRYAVAALFIFSGFSKAIDPWGTSFVIDEYLRAYAMESFLPWSLTLSILLSGFELMLGIMVLIKLLPRITSLVALVVMTIFTIVTLLSATVFTIAVCGCFGEVLKLSPWLTFTKNVVILPFVAYLWWHYRKLGWFDIDRRSLGVLGAVVVVAFGVGVYSYLYLPFIDMSPYKKGANLLELAMPNYGELADEDTYIYKNLSDGELREFTLDELAEVSDNEWEWVETKSATPAVAEQSADEGFTIADAEGDATVDILSYEGTTYLLCITEFDAVTLSCAERMKGVVVKAEKEGSQVVILTPDVLNGVTYYNFIDSPLVRCYNIDGRVMKNLLRAENGLVVLENGIIREKYNCRSIDF